MNNTNYQKELEKIISNIPEGVFPKLLLHSCCAPCSSYCMEYLREFFDITVFYYNPNISSDAEYRKRVEEEKRLIAEYNRQVEAYARQGNDEGLGMTITDRTRRIEMNEGDYDPSEFFEQVRGYEKCKEGGERCFLCYELRLQKSFEMAQTLGMDYVTTTLTISPLKNARKINEIGYRLSENYVNHKPLWLPSDFKKKNGYKRSIELSKEYSLYRQDFCGCIYSKMERDAKADAD